MYKKICIQTKKNSLPNKAPANDHRKNAQPALVERGWVRWIEKKSTTKNQLFVLHAKLFNNPLQWCSADASTLYGSSEYSQLFFKNRFFPEISCWRNFFKISLSTHWERYLTLRLSLSTMFQSMTYFDKKNVWASRHEITTTTTKPSSSWSNHHDSIDSQIITTIVCTIVISRHRRSTRNWHGEMLSGPIGPEVASEIECFRVDLLIVVPLLSCLLRAARARRFEMRLLTYIRWAINGHAKKKKQLYCEVAMWR